MKYHSNLSSAYVLGRGDPDSLFKCTATSYYILGSWYRASRINIKQTNTMELGS
jgi:hypothetical protein